MSPWTTSSSVLVATLLRCRVACLLPAAAAPVLSIRSYRDNGRVLNARRMTRLEILLCSLLTRPVTCPVVVPVFLAMRDVVVWVSRLFSRETCLVPLRLRTRLILMCPCPILNVTACLPLWPCAFPATRGPCVGKGTWKVCMEERRLGARGCGCCDSGGPGSLVRCPCE